MTNGLYWIKLLVIVLLSILEGNKMAYEHEGMRKYAIVTYVIS